ncbi:DUF6716 putative glycosyltransferase [Aeromicrobium sp.]|uniref:DUF6716 putative glycosyltransferase n=1 Tax=Aeromicrobium sp. TaxID=1871063 RepID=UPI002FC772E5
MTGLPRVLLVTDSDSYVKWGAALAHQIPKDWGLRLVVAKGNAEPSPRQLAEAIEGTRFEGRILERVGLDDMQNVLDTWRPDVVVAACRGWAVDALVRLIPNVPGRPVLVSGLAGIAVPVLSYGLGFRRAVDVFITHSRRELREFTEASARLGIPHRYELATVPFISTAPRVEDHDSMTDTGRPPKRDRIIFAAQAMVPESRRDRMWLVRRLIEIAKASPDLKIVIKVRARDGEPQTHVEHFSYESLLDDLVAAGEVLPVNLVVESGAMSRHLSRAVGFVTVSSTAILESIAEDVPCLALSDFGVGGAQINVVLEGSGLLGTSDDLVDGAFRHPDPEWLEDNYFHDPAENTWLVALESLLEQRDRQGLTPYVELPPTVINRAKSMLYRHLAFAPDRHDARAIAERSFLAVALWINRKRWAVLHAVRGLRF